MRFIIAIIIGISLIGGSTWVIISYPEVRNVAIDYLQKGKMQTLEVRHSAESIMDIHKRELLKDSDHIYLEPKFFNPRDLANLFNSLIFIL